MSERLEHQRQTEVNNFNRNILLCFVIDFSLDILNFFQIVENVHFEKKFEVINRDMNDSISTLRLVSFDETDA